MAGDIRELERWIEQHPVHANFTAIGLGILVFELSMLLKVGLDWLASCAR